jgi:alcohol dehydrogenase (cytochrome c)
MRQPSRALAAPGFALALAVALVSGQQPPAAVYTAEQAAAGRAAYQTSCAGCHMADLGGRNEAPQLAGNNFTSTWRSRTTRDLLEFTQSTMPPSGESLPVEQYVNIIAYILQSNGAPAGTQPFTPTTAVPIGAAATGATPSPTTAASTTAAAPSTVPAAAAGGGGGRGGGGRGGAANAGPLGLTVTGTVKNFTDVTDEMLRNPDPGDWLMARRNYPGWSHTPLTQITRENVKELQLAWVWAMNESGAANEPTPIVHNGTMFLTNPGNVLQALDARTGDLIWEHRVGPNATVGIAAMRNMAIYQDKVFLATTDARLTALDARTGKKVWDTPIADRSKGYANTAGPMVVKGVVVNGLVGCDRYGNDGCWISGYDAATGKQLWKFNTVRRGTETGSETWGKLADNLRVGGETWIAGSYDPDLVELRQRPLYELHRRAPAEGRHAGVALPARAGRIARSR